RITDEDANRVDLVLSLAAASDMVRSAIYGPLQTSHGISEGKFSLLMMLYGEGPKLTTELAEALGVAAATVSVMVKRMLTSPEPLIASEKIDSDARARRIVLSEHGRSLVQELLPDHFAAMRAASDRLSATEREALTLLLRKLLGQS
ncbi:MAG: MarR family winged helix-turn-helix transcriptional regulator, partial [Duodenibacillus sp.]